MRPYLPTQRFAPEPPPRQFGFPDQDLEHRRGNWRDVSDAPLSQVSKMLATPGGSPVSCTGIPILPLTVVL